MPMAILRMQLIAFAGDEACSERHVEATSGHQIKGTVLFFRAGGKHKTGSERA